MKGNGNGVRDYWKTLAVLQFGVIVTLIGSILVFALYQPWQARIDTSIARIERQLTEEQQRTTKELQRVASHLETIDERLRKVEISLAAQNGRRRVP